MVDRGLEEPTDAGDGRAELVGHDADELLLRLGDLAEPRALLPGPPEPPQQDAEQQRRHETREREQQDKRSLDAAAEVALELRGVLDEHRTPRRARHVGHRRHPAVQRAEPRGSAEQRGLVEVAGEE
jgi:hypothetical protein